MKYSLRPWVGGGRESLPEKQKKEETSQILQIAVFGQNRVPDRDFEALRGAESMKNEVPERLGPLPGPKTPENDRKSRFFLVSRIFGVENA